MPKILSAKKLHFRFPHSGFSVEDVSLALESGEILGFLGRNGAGKSNVMRMLLGIVRRISGTVEFRERFICREYFSRLGVLIERGAIYSNLTAEENLKLH